LALRLSTTNAKTGGKRARFYSINVMRARHPAWFQEDLDRLFGLLASGAIRPRVAERISFEVGEAHLRLEAGGLEVLSGPTASSGIVRVGRINAPVATAASTDCDPRGNHVANWPETLRTPPEKR
jgi:hypothetical protein